MKILDIHFKEMARCETSRFGAISCLVSCLLLRMLHGNAKCSTWVLKKMEEDSTGAAGLALEDHSLFVSGRCGTGETFL